MKNKVLFIFVFLSIITSNIDARELFMPSVSGHEMPLVLIDGNKIYYRSFFRWYDIKHTFIIYNFESRKFEEVVDKELPKDIVSLAMDENYVYFGGTGLSVYNKDNGRIVKWQDYNSFFIRAIVVDGNDLWLGTNKGLYQVDKESKIIRKIYKKENGLNDDSIYSLFIDRNYIFIGTGRYSLSINCDFYGKGVNVLDLKTQQVTPIIPPVGIKEWDEKDLLLNIYPIKGKDNWYRIICWGYWNLLKFDYNINTKESVLSNGKYYFIDGYLNRYKVDENAELAKQLICFIIDSVRKKYLPGTIGELAVEEAVNTLLSRRDVIELKEILASLNDKRIGDIIYSSLKQKDEETIKVIHNVLLKSIKGSNEDEEYAIALGLANLNDPIAVPYLLKRAYKTNELTEFTQVWKYINVFNKQTIESEVDSLKDLSPDKLLNKSYNSDWYSLKDIFDKAPSRVIMLLEEKGINTKYRNIYGESLCFTLVKLTDSIDAIALLLKQGEDINGQNKRGETPLMVACSRGNEKIIKLLLQSGAKIEHQNHKGETAIYYIIDRFGSYKSNIEGLLELLMYHPDLNIKNNDGETILIKAIKRSFYSGLDMKKKVIELLLTEGANINDSDISGNTPIMVAAKYGEVEVVDLLIKNGANINLLNINGKTTLSIAKEELSRTKDKYNNRRLKLIIDILIKNGIKN